MMFGSECHVSSGTDCINFGDPMNFHLLPSDGFVIYLILDSWFGSAVC